jgi:phage tail-like protein
MSNYPPVGFSFRVNFEISGDQEVDTQFQEVSGMSMALDSETFAEGGENRFTHKLPTRAQYADLVLKRGLSTSSVLNKWCEDAIVNLDIKLATVAVHLLNDKLEPLMSYSFVNAYPKKWEISDLNAMQSGIVIEKLTLSYQYFRVIR